MVATAEKDDKVAPNGGWGGWVIRAMPELKRFFLSQLFPKKETKNARICDLPCFETKVRICPA